MKQYFLLCFVAICSQILYAQSQNFNWAAQYGNSGVSDATLLTLDEQGNRYMSGVYGTTGITLGSFTLSGAGGQSRFIAKFSPSGVVLWAKRITRTLGSQDGRNSEKIAVDTSGNVYFTGSYFPGATVDGVPLSGEYNLFLTKFDSNGVVVWMKTTSSPYFLNNSPCAIHVDSENNICMVGSYQASMSFSDTYSLTAENSSNVGAQSFLVKYNPVGDVVFASNIGPVDSLYNIGVGDADNDLFQFDENDNIYRFADTLLTKYNPSGVPLHQHLIRADSSYLLISSFAIDLNGNVLLSGYFQNGPLVFMGDTLEQNGLIDAVIIKLDSNGTKQWIHQNIVTNNGSSIYSKVRVDGIGNVYATGKVISELQIQPIMMLKLNAQGDVLWEDLILSTNSPSLPEILGALEPRNIVQAQNGGNILILGAFTKYIEFNSSTIYTTPQNVIRLFLAQYGNCSNAEVPAISSPSYAFCEGDGLVLTASESSEYLWNTGDTTQSIYVNSPGDYYVFGIENNECYVKSEDVQVSRLETPGLSVMVDGETLLAEQEEATYQWINCTTNSLIAEATNQEYNSTLNGSYAAVITNANGCVDTTACYCINSFIPTVSSAVTAFCAGDSVLLVASELPNYLWNTGDTTQSIYTNASGDFYVLDIVDSECSVQSNTIQLEILDMPSLNVFQNGETLTAEQQGATYQWINCNGNTPILGETNQTYNATTNGDYAVVITNSSSCSDTTACFTVSIIDIGEYDLPNSISIWPNPADNTLTIESEFPTSPIRIYDTQGRLVLETTMISKRVEINVRLLQSGLYFIQTEKESQRFIILHDKR